MKFLMNIEVVCNILTLIVVILKKNVFHISLTNLDTHEKITKYINYFIIKYTHYVNINKG